MECDLDKLTATVQGLRDEADITRCLYTYAHAIDYGDEGAWVDCFTSDATWSAYNRVTGQRMRRDGRADLLEYASHHTRAPAVYHKHVVTTPLITLSGDTASCVCYMLLVVGDHNDVPQMVTFGRYRDEFARCSDSRWRIRARECEPESWNDLWRELRGDAGWR